MTKLRSKMIFFVFLVLSLVCVNTVKADTLDFSIDSVEIKNKVGTIEVVDPVLSSNKITSGIIFNQKDDEVSFEITLKNNTDTGFMIQSINDNNTNDHLKISYEYDDEYFYSNETKTFILTMKYVDEIINIEETDITDLKISLKFINEQEIKGEEIVIVNPTTGDNINLFIIVLIASLVAMIVILAVIEVKYKKVTLGIFLLLLIIAMIPMVFNITKSYAENSYTLEFNNIIVMGKLDEFNVSILDFDNNEIETRVIKYGYPIGEVTYPDKTGYEYSHMEDENGNTLTSDMKVYKDIVIKPIYNLIDYTITYYLYGGTADNPTTYNYETETFTLNQPTRTDYIFMGWYGSNGSTFKKNVQIKQHSTGDKTYKAKWKPVNAVAEINGEFFTTLDAAMNYVHDNTETTILILDDINEMLYVGNKKNVIVDLNGFNISYICNDPGNCNTVRNYGKLTIKNGSLSNQTDSGVINNYKDANLIVDGVTITATGKRQGIYNRGNVTLIGGTNITADTNERAAVHNLSTGTVIVEDATITSKGASGIENNGVLVIGTHDGINTYEPRIKGELYGVYSTKTFDFYNGLLVGIKAGTNNTVEHTEDYTVVTTGDEEIDEKTYKTIFLKDAFEIHLDTNGGIEQYDSFIVGTNDPIGTLPRPTHETLYFEGWYTDLTEGEKILFDYEVTSDMTLYARWSETDLFPIVFEQIGECTINCDNNITGDECSAYTDSKAIDTGFSLFSSENINLDFELSMDFVVDLKDPLIERSSTLVANKDEVDSVSIVYGFAFRVEGDYHLTYSNDAENATVITSNKALHSLRLVRKNNKLYYSFDGEELKFFADADVDHPFDSHLIFGAALNENQEEFRYLPGTISNIKVRLGKMN